MAETIGIIASGIAMAQVVAAVGATVVRLKQVLSEIRDVPGYISDLIEQIECLDPALWELEQDLGQNEISHRAWDTPAAKRSAMYCRKALNGLATLVDELSAQVNSPKRLKRHVARVKVGLNGETLKRSEQKLEAIIRMLQCAQQGYILVLMKQQPEVMAREVLKRLDVSRNDDIKPLGGDDTYGIDREVNTATDSRPDDPDIIVNRTTCESTPSIPLGDLSMSRQLVKYQASQTFSAHFRPPWWLTGFMYACSLQIGRCYSGWNFQFRSYSIRPLSAPVFEAARIGNVVALRSLLDARQASPYDVSEEGNTLLHWAANSAAVEIIRLLIQMGCEVNGKVQNYSGFTPIDWLDTSTAGVDKVNECFDLLKHDWTTRQRGIAGDDSVCSCPRTSNWENFCRLQPLLCPSHHETSLLSRLERAGTLDLGPVRRVYHILNPDWSVDPEQVCSIVERHCALIHTVARNIGEMSELRQKKGLSAEEAAKWHAFAVEVVQKSHNIHLTGEYRDFVDTPLVFVLRAANQAYIGKGRKQFESNIAEALHQWIKILKASSVDLQAYGAGEAQLLRRTEVKLTWYWEGWSLSTARNFTHEWKLINIQYGADIEDWKLWLSEPTDGFAGEFWRMTEAFECHIPGGWNESDDEC